MVKRLRLFLLFLVLFAGFFVLNNTKSPVIPLVSFPEPIPTTTPPKETTVIAPDMKQTLIMKEQKDSESVRHSFLTVDKEGETPKQVFSKTVDAERSISIPFNTWSPGNKYLFLKEASFGKGNYIVLTSNGSPLSKNFQTVNIGDLFNEKYSDYIITDVTGWAAPTLIIVNTNNADGTTGPSFWFDVTTLSFIKLSIRFN